MLRKKKANMFGLPTTIEILIVVFVIFLIGLVIPQIANAKNTICLRLGGCNLQSQEDTSSETETQTVIEDSNQKKEEAKKVLTSFTEQYNSINNKFTTEQKESMVGHCIIGAFDNLKIPEGYKMVIESKAETEGKIDPAVMVKRLTEYSQNQVLAKTEEENNIKALYNYLQRSYRVSSENQKQITEIASSLGFKGDFQDYLNDFVNKLISDRDKENIQKLLEYSYGSPLIENIETLEELAKKLGITKTISASANVESEIFFLDGKDMKNLGLVQPIDTLSFIYPRSALSDTIEEHQIKENARIVFEGDEVIIYQNYLINPANNYHPDLEENSFILLLHDHKTYWSVEAKDKISEKSCDHYIITGLR